MLSFNNRKSAPQEPIQITLLHDPNMTQIRHTTITDAEMNMVFFLFKVYGVILALKLYIGEGALLLVCALLHWIIHLLFYIDIFSP